MSQPLGCLQLDAPAPVRMRRGERAADTVQVSRVTLAVYQLISHHFIVGHTSSAFHPRFLALVL